VGVKHGSGSSLLARHLVLVGLVGSARRHFQQVVPLGRQLTQTGHTEGQDSVGDLVEGGGSRTVSSMILSSGPRGPAEIVLLGFVEDTIHTIHTGGQDSRLGVDDV
jgi:hypothetical protein